jgi:hypothetical protein
MGTAANLAATFNVCPPAKTPATADTSLTAPTNTTTIFTGGASGSRVDRIRITQIASTAAAGIINFFRKHSGVYYLVASYAYGIVTLSTTSQAAPVDIDFDQGLPMANGDTLEDTVTTSAGQTAFVVQVMAGGDY